MHVGVFNWCSINSLCRSVSEVMINGNLISELICIVLLKIEITITCAQHNSLLTETRQTYNESQASFLCYHDGMLLGGSMINKMIQRQRVVLLAM